jgi:hypothetical protein
VDLATDGAAHPAIATVEASRPTPARKLRRDPASVSMLIAFLVRRSVDRLVRSDKLQARQIKRERSDMRDDEVFVVT